MHMQLLHNNQVVIFDRTDFGQSNLTLPDGRCRYDTADFVLSVDCTAHSILYDIYGNTFRPLMVQTDTWCSSGAVLPNGTLVQIGGYNDGDHVVRSFTPCDQYCDWVEFPGYLSERRWYATNQILPDGRIIIIGGRRQFSYEFFTRVGDAITLHFLRETLDSDENNLYPFVHLLPDGSLFIFANTRSILFDYDRNRVVKEFPRIPGEDPRNYPSTGSSVLLPLDENRDYINPEVMVCGGAPGGGYRDAMDENFRDALSTCGRIKTSDANPRWVMEEMPGPRVMGDMIIIPQGDILIINGATQGTAGWNNARDPETHPFIYRPHAHPEQRFSTMPSSSRPRLYHSSAILLPDGRILVGGSNPQPYYNFTHVLFPTDLSLQVFMPPYMSNDFDIIKPEITFFPLTMRYREPLALHFQVRQFSSFDNVTVRIVAPSFTTHSFGMNQRMVVLKMNGGVTYGTWSTNIEGNVVGPSTSAIVNVVGPSTSSMAPPGYYMLFVVHRGIPSTAVWVQVYE